MEGLGSDYEQALHEVAHHFFTLGLTLLVHAAFPADPGESKPPPQKDFKCILALIRSGLVEAGIDPSEFTYRIQFDETEKSILRRIHVHSVHDFLRAYPGAYPSDSGVVTLSNFLSLLADGLPVPILTDYSELLGKPPAYIAKQPMAILRLSPHLERLLFARGIRTIADVGNEYLSPNAGPRHRGYIQILNKLTPLRLVIAGLEDLQPVSRKSRAERMRYPARLLKLTPSNFQALKELGVLSVGDLADDSFQEFYREAPLSWRQKYEVAARLAVIGLSFRDSRNSMISSDLQNLSRSEILNLKLTN